MAQADKSESSTQTHSSVRAEAPVPDCGATGTDPIPLASDALADYAFFFDLDGTLAPIAPTPDAARVPEETRLLLRDLARGSGGAVAIVSGRSAADIDRLLAPLTLPLAGLHGAQWRGADGRLRQIDMDAAPVERMARRLDRLLQGRVGVELERKTLSVAVHFRNAPECEALVRDAVHAVARGQAGDFTVQPGKMVMEIKPRACDKAGAIQWLLDAPPFTGRVPVFAGDDLTDEAGFAAVNARAGISIKIGAGVSAARWRLCDPAALAAWLGTLVR